MKRICIIGAGNIGSRHLQGLKKVTAPLSIEVVDPSIESLNIAKQRYDQIQSLTNHKINFSQNLDKILKEIDLAIIATSSNVRRKVIEDLLSKSSVRYLILEKILFQKEKDYLDMENLLKKKKIKTWVNFSMRTMPFYQNLKGKFKVPIQLIVSGNRFGLITNAIHFVDYITYLTGSDNFKVLLDAIDPKIIESKRKGFLELNGTLSVNFEDGNSGSFSCYPDGDAPFIIEVLSENYHIISRESERKAWISSDKDGWKWKEVETDIPYQSDMTNILVDQILQKGICSLTSYSQASKIHQQLLENLLKFLNKYSDKKFNFYPFT